MVNLELVLGLLVLMVALVTLARRLRVAYPILLVLGGLALGFTPGIPTVALPPDLVLLTFLPPLLYWESLNSPLRDLRANIRAIGLLAIGLVLATVIFVRVVAHLAIPNLPWAAAFTLGAIVAPTDTVATSAIAERLGLPRRLLTVLEGESLVNDASALVVYRVALAAVVTGAFSLWQAGAQFILSTLGAVAIGLAVGWLIATLRRPLHDPPVENTISLLSGFAAYLPAEALGVSGVIAVVTTGLYLGRRGPRFVRAETRLQAEQLWEVVVFLLNGLIFVLVGLQLRSIVAGLHERPFGLLLWYGLIVGLAVIVIRILWMFPATYLPRYLSHRLRERDPYPTWRAPAALSWAGMRGGVSLAAALALPATIRGGSPFPDRDLIIFLTFCVIVMTLVGQGLTLPVVIRRLRLHADDSAQREEAVARFKTTRAALAYLDTLEARDIPADVLDDLRVHYDTTRQRFAARLDGAQDDDREREAQTYTQLRKELLGVERNMLIHLRDRNVINDTVMQRVQRDLDLEEVRLDGDP